MTIKQPRLIVLGGPNGAGKSTAAPALLHGTLGVTEFVNADVIARGLSAFQPERAAIEAGRIMLKRIRELASQGIHFAFETTLASRTFAPWITELQQKGYAFLLVFLWLPSSEMAITRVLERVRRGGHNVPEATIRRRYHAGLKNFFKIYRPLADQWRFYDNSDPTSGPRLLARGRKDSELIRDVKIWEKIVKGLPNEGS